MNNFVSLWKIRVQCHKFSASVFYVTAHSFWETLPRIEELTVLCCCQMLFQSLLMQQDKGSFEEGTKVDMTLIRVTVSSVRKIFLLVVF